MGSVNYLLQNNKKGALTLLQHLVDIFCVSSGILCTKLLLYSRDGYTYNRLKCNHTFLKILIMLNKIKLQMIKQCVWFLIGMTAKEQVFIL